MRTKTLKVQNFRIRSTVIRLLLKSTVSQEAFPLKEKLRLLRVACYSVLEISYRKVPVCFFLSCRLFTLILIMIFVPWNGLFPKWQEMIMDFLDVAFFFKYWYRSRVQSTYFLDTTLECIFSLTVKTSTLQCQGLIISSGFCFRLLADGSCDDWSSWVSASHVAHGLDSWLLLLASTWPKPLLACVEWINGWKCPFLFFKHKFKQQKPRDKKKIHNY